MVRLPLLRIDGGIRGGLVPVVVSVLVLALTLISPAPADAHCPGTAAHDYAYGNQGLGFNVNGVNAQISWTKGNVCTSGVSHSVSVCSAGSCTKWAQAGWRYYSGWANPLMYCEWGGGTYKLMDFALSAATHTYQQRFDAASSEWDCTLDGAVKFSWSLANAGFSLGTYVVAQGENHQAHVQIGRMAPAKLLFANLQYRKVSDASWPAMDIVPRVSGGPYGADEPGVGQLRVWTNAH